MDYKLSVVIPSYREEGYIEETLKALRNQDYKNVEVIVVDSSPDEKTRDVAKKYADKTLHFPERGVSKARNLGAQNSSGDIIVFIDADTVIKKDALAKIARAFAEDEKMVCCCAYVEVESSLLNRILFMLVSESVWLMAKLGMPLFYGFCVAYRKDTFDKVCFNEKLVTCEDIDVSKRAARLGKCKLLRDVRVLTSARRVEKGGTLRIVVFHMQNLIRYTLSSKACEDYPVFR